MTFQENFRDKSSAVRYTENGEREGMEQARNLISRGMVKGEVWDFSSFKGCEYLDLLWDLRVETGGVTQSGRKVVYLEGEWLLYLPVHYIKIGKPRIRFISRRPFRVKLMVNSEFHLNSD
ncbi:hypothetical protein L1049_013773 [Liquidambar formosana]|uniref:Uncharacterized protein n=1 Tax=Liquidambar formosana TaxID=63359 RepID=A0AAP0WYM7_LIQFO